MIDVARALVGHAVFALSFFGPVVVLGGEAAILLGLPTQLGALTAVGVFLTWIGARAGQREVWAEGPRR
jgi:hypothetical protein